MDQRDPDISEQIAPFEDRWEAGKLLAEACSEFSDRPDVIVLGLPRGGVPVGFEVARALHAPLDVLIVRKLGVPSHEELAMGAIASGGMLVLNSEIIDQLGIPQEQINAAITRELSEIQRRERIYRGERPRLDVKNRTVLIIDDGLATGATMIAAVRAVKSQKPKEIIVAVPVAAPDACEILRKEANRVICVRTPQFFQAVGKWYNEFPQTSDQEVRELLDGAQEFAFDDGVFWGEVAPGPTITHSDSPEHVQISFDTVDLLGTLTVPAGARGIVVFAHGSGSSRDSPRNRQVADVLRKHNHGTLLFDLLTIGEETVDQITAHLRFDIQFLSYRLLRTTEWLQSRPEAKGKPIGYFGASTGSAAALVAAAEKPSIISAIVSRGGRPDLAFNTLKKIKAPTLFIVGELDLEVLELNRTAFDQLTTEKELRVIPGATHLFEENGALAEVASRAAAWFDRYLV